MLIGVLNLIILISLINFLAELRREHIEEAEVDVLLESRGFVSRFVGPYFKLITRSSARIATWLFIWTWF